VTLQARYTSHDASNIPARVVSVVGKGKGISLMVWGCFWGRKCGTFCPLIVKSVNKGVYANHLQYPLLTVIKCIYHTLGDAIIQHDNAAVQKAAVVKDFLPKYNIQVEDGPPYSPDLNPIEHDRVALKRRIHKKYPDITNTTRKNDLTRRVTHREAVFGTVIHSIFDAWHYECPIDLHVD
jgi:hypothetical protein